jgi:N-acetylmuramoyl-L-alanine amidase
VSRFQKQRHLYSTGECDEATWTALVEASYGLGDRLLKLTSPNIRGDDVVDLQSRLAHLGFDCGKVDGIFGPRTAQALQGFQRNCGLLVDGICGTETVALMDRLALQSGDGPGIAALREQETLLCAGRGLDGCKVVIGQFGGASAVARMAGRQLRHGGALVVLLDELDPYVQASTANEFGADLYIGLTLRDQPGLELTYYAVPSFESAAGRSVALQLAGALASWRVSADCEIVGARLPILRETRMPAVFLSAGPVRTVMDQTPALAAALSDAISGWFLRVSRAS